MIIFLYSDIYILLYSLASSVDNMNSPRTVQTYLTKKLRDKIKA